MAETSLSLIVPNTKKKTPQFSSSSSVELFCRNTLFYDKLPSQPLRLSVLKLDGSSFDIQVSKTATIAELKDAVEAVFSYSPQHGPGKIS
ncbi:U11/U12 small nuclear ribonucleoprotein 25 kDa protein, partial [Trifolium pratense]